METPSATDLNPYSEIWPLEHNAEIWGHRPKDFFKQDPESIAIKPDETPPHETPNNPPIARPLDQYYDKAEVFAALRDLSKEEINQMQSFARFRLIGKTGRPGYVEVEDLFIDAAIRTMEQKRSWTRGVTVFNHFFAVMRSIAHQRFRQAGRYTPLNELVAASQNRSLSTLDAQTNVARLKEQLRGDAVALDILESMMDETRARNTQLALGISAEVYWAARKRIRRMAEHLRGAADTQRCSTSAKGHRPLHGRTQRQRKHIYT